MGASRIRVEITIPALLPSEGSNGGLSAVRRLSPAMTNVPSLLSAIGQSGNQRCELTDILKNVRMFVRSLKKVYLTSSVKKVLHCGGTAN